MDKSKNKNFQFFNGIKRLLKWTRRLVFIFIAAFMIGLSNVFNEENRSINDINSFVKQEQLIDNEDANE